MKGSMKNWIGARNELRGTIKKYLRVAIDFLSNFYCFRGNELLWNFGVDGLGVKGGPTAWESKMKKWRMETQVV